MKTSAHTATPWIRFLFTHEPPTDALTAFVGLSLVTKTARLRSLSPVPGLTRPVSAPGRRKRVLVFAHERSANDLTSRL